MKLSYQKHNVIERETVILPEGNYFTVFEEVSNDGEKNTILNSKAELIGDEKMARLFASAPDLLEALIGVLNVPCIGFLAVDISGIKKAIAKARGEK